MILYQKRVKIRIRLSSEVVCKKLILHLFCEKVLVFHGNSFQTHVLVDVE
jgi:hypothetical protein